MGFDLCCMTNRIGDDDRNGGFFRLNTLLVNLQYVIHQYGISGNKRWMPYKMIENILGFRTLFNSFHNDFARNDSEVATP